MSYRRYDYTYPSYPLVYSIPSSRTTSRETTTTTESSYAEPGTLWPIISVFAQPEPGPADYKYTYETTTSRVPHRSVYPDYRAAITTSGYRYSPKWYDTNVTRTTTKTGEKKTVYPAEYVFLSEPLDQDHGQGYKDRIVHSGYLWLYKMQGPYGLVSTRTYRY